MEQSRLYVRVESVLEGLRVEPGRVEAQDPTLPFRITILLAARIEVMREGAHVAKLLASCNTEAIRYIPPGCVREHDQLIEIGIHRYTPGKVKTSIVLRVS